MNNDDMTKSTLDEGKELHGDSIVYRIESVLGQGSFGITYKAKAFTVIKGKFGEERVEVKTPKAIKEFFMKEVSERDESGSITGMSEGSLSYNYALKFRKEVEHLASMDHPNIVKVIDFISANNTYYYVMDYIGGGSLDDYISERNGLAEDEAIKLIKQIGSALSCMHKCNMLHLDVKPANIMRKETGEVVLIDFGLSKQYDDKGEPESSTTVGGGTPGYAPIEQANYREGKGFPITMDVYALGATLFKMLTGVRPPVASDIFTDGFPLDELQERHVSERTCATVAKAMQPNKKERFQSVDEFLASLEEEVTVVDKEEVKRNNYHKEPKTESVFLVQPNTSRVTIAYDSPFSPSHGSYFCSVDRQKGVSISIYAETSRLPKKMSAQEYSEFLAKVQSLNLKVRDKEVPPYSHLEYSENPGKLTIVLWDENDEVYNKFWISGWENELGNILGDIHELEKQIRAIVPTLQGAIDEHYQGLDSKNDHEEPIHENNEQEPSDGKGIVFSPNKMKHLLYLIFAFLLGGGLALLDPFGCKSKRGDVWLDTTAVDTTASVVVVEDTTVFDTAVYDSEEAYGEWLNQDKSVKNDESPVKNDESKIGSSHTNQLRMTNPRIKSQKVKEIIIR